MSLTIKVTPVNEDGRRGDTITHSNVEHDEFVGDPMQQELVLTAGGKEYRYPLAGHFVELIEDVDDGPQLVDETEQPDDLGRTSDEVRVQYFRDQAAADHTTGEQDA